MTNFTMQAKRFNSWWHEDDHLYLCDGFVGLRYKTDIKPSGLDNLAGGLSHRARGDNFNQLCDYMPIVSSITMTVKALRKMGKSLKATAKVNRNDTIGMTLCGQWANISESVASVRSPGYLFNPTYIITALNGLKGEVTLTIRATEKYGASHILVIKQENYKGLVMGIQAKYGFRVA